MVHPYHLQPSFHTYSTEPEPTARSESGRRILLDNSCVYVRFLPFVSGRVHPGRISEDVTIFRHSVRAARNGRSRAPRLSLIGSEPQPASISDDTTQMDYNAVVLFTIDRLARSPRTRCVQTPEAPDPWFEINLRFRRFSWDGPDNRLDCVLHCSETQRCSAGVGRSESRELA